MLKVAFALIVIGFALVGYGYPSASERMQLEVILHVIAVWLVLSALAFANPLLKR